jgi:hypothetical protein
MQVVLHLPRNVAIRRSTFLLAQISEADYLTSQMSLRLRIYANIQALVRNMETSQLLFEQGRQGRISDKMLLLRKVSVK